MAKFEILSQSEYDESHQLCTIKVTADLGDDDVRSYDQDVIFETSKVEAKAQEYADELESALKEQKVNGTLAPREDVVEAPAEGLTEE